MAFSLRVQEEAYRDIEEAVAYYFGQSLQAGVNFRKELNNSFRTLETNPHFRFIYKDFRVLPMRVFPYIIVFKVLEDSGNVTVYAVFNTYRNPQEIKVRIKG